MARVWHFCFSSGSLSVVDVQSLRSPFKERFSLGFEVCWGVVLTFPFFLPFRFLFRSSVLSNGAYLYFKVLFYRLCLCGSIGISCDFTWVFVLKQCWKIKLCYRGIDLETAVGGVFFTSALSGAFLFFSPLWVSSFCAFECEIGYWPVGPLGIGISSFSLGFDCYKSWGAVPLRACRLRYRRCWELGSN